MIHTQLHTTQCAGGSWENHIIYKKQRWNLEPTQSDTLQPLAVPHNIVYKNYTTRNEHHLQTKGSLWLHRDKKQLKYDKKYTSGFYIFCLTLIPVMGMNQFKSCDQFGKCNTCKTLKHLTAKICYMEECSLQKVTGVRLCITPTRGYFC